MAEHRTIIVKGPYIARQDIGVQILHAEHVHTEPSAVSSQHSECRIAEDVEFEDVPKAEELPTMEQLSKISPSNTGRT